MALVGQVASERKPVILTEPPEDYMTISTGTTDSVPRHLAIIPLVHGQEVLGVVEMAAVRTLSARQAELLQQAVEPVTVALMTARSRARVDELLRKTQNQARELQQQQEELRQTNEELQQQQEELRQTNEELQRGQEQLRESYQELERRTQIQQRQQAEIQRQNEELETARRSLEEKARALEVASRYKSEFLANMSHELRTPLNSLLILSRLLADNKDGNLTAKQVDFARTINKAGSDLLTLINDILDLSKVEAGRMEFHMDSVRLADVCQDLEGMFLHVAQDKRLEFAVERAEAVPEAVKTDAARLAQILKNLLGNAFKFTNHGSVRLRLRVPEAGEIAEIQAAVAFDVVDTGIGIAKKHHEGLFQAFRQVDGGTARKFGGTGLGLSISRQLALKLGGDIRFASEEGKGSRFTLYLPAAAPADGGMAAFNTATFTAPSAASAPAAEAAPRPATDNAEPKAASPAPDDREKLLAGDKVMLIVENEEAFSRQVMSVARARGYRCLLAATGEEALSWAQRHVPAGIILSVKLPDMSGWAVMQRLKDNPATRHVPVHFITCVNHPNQGYRMGAVGYLVKPADETGIDEAIKRIETVASREVKRLLLVEDSVAEIADVQDLLGGQKVETVVAQTGAAAIQKLKDETVDCIVLDLGLADMSGFDLLETIRKEPAYRTIPVIIHTARQLTREEEARLRRCSDSIVVKGVRSRERLLDEVTLFLHLPPSSMPADKQKLIALAHGYEHALAGRKVLVVDDDMRNVFSLCSLLEELHVQTSVAINGKEALERLRAEPDIDLVLMDIMMPEMDGLEAIRHIREDLELRRLPVVALTAKATRGDREACLAAGANDYLSKPVEPERLFAVMRLWIQM